MRRRFVLLVAGGAVAVLFALGYLWLSFHSIPTQSDLRAAIANADAVEIVRFEEKRPSRYARLEGPQRIWNDWPGTLQFRQRFWSFGSPPIDSWLVQTFSNGRRSGAFEIRSDDCVYLRKAVRWYRMPVDPAFREIVVRALEAHSGPVPEETLREYDRYMREQI